MSNRRNEQKKRATVQSNPERVRDMILGGVHMHPVFTHYAHHYEDLVDVLLAGWLQFLKDGNPRPNYGVHGWLKEQLDTLHTDVKQRRQQKLMGTKDLVN